MHPAPSTEAQQLERRIQRAGRNGVPALTAIADCRAIDELKDHDVVRWTGRRWIHRTQDGAR
jgi:hypothetical protein